MENKDRNILYGYILIEFALFIASYIMGINMRIEMNYHIMSSIGFLINAVFLAIYRMRMKSDRPYAIIFSSLILISEILTALSLLKISSVMYILSYGSFSIWICQNIEKKKRIIPYAVSSLVSLSSTVFVFLGIMDSSIILLVSTAILSIESVIIMAITYNNGNVLHKPNWFFGIMGSIIYVVYLLCAAFGPSMDDTALMKQMVVTGSSVLLIPSTLMLSITFIFFQQREA